MVHSAGELLAEQVIERSPNELWPGKLKLRIKRELVSQEQTDVERTCEEVYLENRCIEHSKSVRRLAQLQALCFV